MAEYQIVQQVTVLTVPFELFLRAFLNELVMKVKFCKPDAEWEKASTMAQSTSIERTNAKIFT
jgi:hypothetical protein